MKLILLGTGTPAPSLERQSSGYLVDTGKDLIALDHGPGAHHRLLEAGRKSTEVTHVFFTHLHYDHCMDYARLVLQRWDVGAGHVPELVVYGPPPIRHMTERLFGDDGAFAPDITSRVSHPASLEVFLARGGVLPRARPRPFVHEVMPGDVIDGDGWRVTVGMAPHFQPYLECLAYRLEDSAGSICYSGDSGGAAEEMIALAQGCDILVHMVQFMSGTEPSQAYRQSVGSHLDAAEVARAAGVRALVLSHTLEAINRPGVRERMIHEVSQVFAGAVVWAEDLMELEVPWNPPGLSRTSFR